MLMHMVLDNFNYKQWNYKVYYIDTDEIPGFLLLLENHIFTARGEDMIFYVWGYWLPNYNSASRSGAQSVDLKFYSQNDLELRRRLSYRIFLIFIRILTFSNRKYKY